MKSTDVVISGAGQAGLVMANLLAKAGFDIIVIDPHLETPATNRTAAIMNQGIEVLNHLGCWQNIAPHATRMEALKIIDKTQHPRIEAAFPSRDLGLKQFGFNTPLHILHKELRRLAHNYKNISFYETVIDHITADKNKISISLQNKQNITAKLLIAADGRQSRVRELSHIPLWRHDYHQTALTGYVEHTQNHHHISTELHYPGGPFTLVPLNEKKSSFVWLEKSPDAHEILKLPKTQFLQALQRKSDDVLGRLHLMDGPQSWPIIAQYTKKLTAPRTALIAEAAHVLTPLGAQGLNLSLRDVTNLYDMIVAAARAGQDIGHNAVLQKYAQQRTQDISPRLLGTHLLSQALVHDHLILHDMRRIGLQMVRDIPALKNFLMRQGLSPDFSLAYTLSDALTVRANVTTSTRATPIA